MSERGRVAILISGRGSNMQSLVHAMSTGEVPADPVLVLSNKSRAAGLAWAKAQGIPTAVVTKRGHASREAHDTAILEQLDDVSPDLICLAGYMRLLSPAFIGAYPERILNIHPSLLPVFPGLDAQQQAIDYGVRVSGCTVHFVDEVCDHGPILMQASVPVNDTDDAESLSKRILVEEHRIYPQAVKKFFSESWVIRGRRVESAP
jgi:phosphoribosylglycinamide formyltransferase-1